MDMSLISKTLEGMSMEDVWNWFWSLFEFDFCEKGLKGEDYQNVHALLIDKYKKDPTVSKKYVSEIEVSTGFTITLGGSMEGKQRFLKRTDSVYEERPKTYRNSIYIEVAE